MEGHERARQEELRSSPKSRLTCETRGRHKELLVEDAEEHAVNDAEDCAHERDNDDHACKLATGVNDRPDHHFQRFEDLALEKDAERHEHDAEAFDCH